MEIFDVIDKDGNPTGETVTRERAHASALYLTPSVIYIPRSFRFDASAYLFDTSGDNGLHWLV